MERAASALFNTHILREAALRFGANAGDYSLISDVENFVYECKRGAEPFILRITHSSHRTVEMIAGELEWIEYLSAHGISTARPLRSVRGRHVEVVDAGSSYFLVTAFSKIWGEPIIEANACTPELYRKWGRMVGRMHALCKDYAPSDVLYQRPTWFENDLIVNAEKYLTDQMSILQKCRKLMRYLYALPQDRDSFGLIHGDFTDVNFFVHDQAITVFDFDDSEYHWLVYDIAVILFDSLRWLPHDGMNWQEFGEYFWTQFAQGYIGENRLEPYWIKQLPRFFKLREMSLFIFFHKKWDRDNLTQRQQDMLAQYAYNIENDLPYLTIDFLRILEET